METNPNVWASGSDVMRRLTFDLIPRCVFSSRVDDFSDKVLKSPSSANAAVASAADEPAPHVLKVYRCLRWRCAAVFSKRRWRRCLRGDAVFVWANTEAHLCVRSTALERRRKNGRNKWTGQTWEGWVAIPARQISEAKQGWAWAVRGGETMPQWGNRGETAPNLGKNPYREREADKTHVTAAAHYKPRAVKGLSWQRRRKVCSKNGVISEIRHEFEINAVTERRAAAETVQGGFFGEFCVNNLEINGSDLSQFEDGHFNSSKQTQKTSY
ncbi:hypothetical protein WMY93_032568 [Mugilogobius chulae]|uniref:Uncharacterized protein n=1 Tax=Mugilogobius chulae TaxID=88201 RepID=A0AAW0MMS5_9GOBI